jgi:hypothetical protein
MAAESSGTGCGKSIVVGCAVVGFLAVTLVAGVWLNRDAIQQMPFFQRLASRVEVAKGEAKMLVALRASLQVRYPADNVKFLMQMHSGSAGRVHRLSVAFINPKFALPEDSDGQQRQAREIAREVARVYPEIDRYDQVRVSFLSVSAQHMTFTRSTDFDFPIADLRAAPPP